MTKGWGIWTIFSSENLESLWFTTDFSANSWLSEIWIWGVPFDPRWYLFVESHMSRNKLCGWGLPGLAIREDWDLGGQLVQISLGQLVDLEPVPANPNCWTPNNCIAIPVAQRLASMKCCFLKEKRSVLWYNKYLLGRRANFQRYQIQPLLIHIHKPCIKNFTYMGRFLYFKRKPVARNKEGGSSLSLK